MVVVVVESRSDCGGYGTVELLLDGGKIISELGHE